jgi:hypothetical protein
LATISQRFWRLFCGPGRAPGPRRLCADVQIAKGTLSASKPMELASLGYALWLAERTSHHVREMRNREVSFTPNTGHCRQDQRCLESARSESSPRLLNQLVCLHQRNRQGSLNQARSERLLRWRAGQDCPTGKSPNAIERPRSPVQSLLKNIPNFRISESDLYSEPSRTHKRGVSRSSRTLARDAMDAGALQDELRSRGRRSRVVLTPRRWRQVSRM